jgi:short-chain fatty acids transporter
MTAAPSTIAAPPPTPVEGGSIGSRLSDLGAALSRFTERWIPDSWVVCMMITVLVLILAVAGPGVSLQNAVLAWGGGMWTLLELSMQLSIALIAAHACVSSPPIFRSLEKLSSLSNPDRPVQAVVVMALYSMITAYFNWALSLVASALFIPFLCRKNPRTDVRLVAAAAYLGQGTVWHGGLSGSAPLILATPNNPLIAPAGGLPALDRLVPVTETIFAPFNLIFLFVIAGTALVTLVLLHPRQGVMTLSTTQVDAMMPRIPDAPPSRPTIAGRLDRFRGWTVLAAALVAYPLGYSLITRGFTAWNINAYNMVFLILALLLHGRPESLVKAFVHGASTASGIILQFPFYAGIFGVMKNTPLGEWMGHFFVRISSARTFPLVVYMYSALMTIFVPSGGSKWLIEAPYLLPAARELGVSVSTTVLSYAYGDSTAHLIQPFWAIPILTVTRLRFGDVVGYNVIVFAACFIVSVVAMLLIPLNL